MENERDARDTIRGLDQIEFGRKVHRLRVEWTKHERGGGRSSGSRRSANMRPSKTSFVINFDTHNTKTRDLEKHFEPYGKIVGVRIWRNFAFVQYECQEDAVKALDATHMSKLTMRKREGTVLVGGHLIGVTLEGVLCALLSPYG